MLRRHLLLALPAALLAAGCATGPATPTLAEAPPIVFVHGNGDTAALWQTTLWRFESNGWPTDRLFAIDQIAASTVAPAYSAPLIVEFLTANPFLVLDTRFFAADFTARILASFDDIDAQLDGVLVHSENFQALNLLQERYREQVKCIYIDPPYNTGPTKILYKNNYHNIH